MATGRSRLRFVLLAAGAALLVFGRRQVTSSIAWVRTTVAGSRTPEPGTDSGTSTDPVTVTALMDGGDEQGYTEQFVLTAAGIRCLGCSELRPPEEYSVEALRRLEGASDPDDAQAVIATHCPVCDAAGSLVLNYGPAASPEESDAIVAMQDRRHESNTVTGTVPGEVPQKQP
jgi:hypothetical protein